MCHQFLIAVGIGHIQGDSSAQYSVSLNGWNGVRCKLEQFLGLGRFHLVTIWLPTTITSKKASDLVHFSFQPLVRFALKLSSVTVTF